MTPHVRAALEFAIENQRPKLFFSILIGCLSNVGTYKYLKTFTGTQQEISSLIKYHWREDKIRAFIKKYATDALPLDSVNATRAWVSAPVPYDFDIRNEDMFKWITKYVTTNSKYGILALHSTMDTDSADSIIDWYVAASSK